MTDAMLDPRRKKMLHRARYRGFKEADILIGGFAEEALPTMTTAELDAFEHVLAMNDHDIYAVVVSDAPPPVDFDRGLLQRMRAFDATARTRNA